MDLKTWSTGVAILTKTLEIWVVSDLESPLCEKLADMGMVYDIDLLFQKSCKRDRIVWKSSLPKLQWDLWNV